MRTHVPVGLRHWFVAHFCVDVLFAVPLFFFPEFFLHLFGWVQIDAALTRVVAAALFGIGIQSLLAREEGADVFRAMLNLKIIWSALAAIGIGYGVLTGTAPLAATMFAFVFAGFCGVWLKYRLGLRRETSAVGAPSSP